MLVLYFYNIILCILFWRFHLVACGTTAGFCFVMAAFFVAGFLDIRLIGLNATLVDFFFVMNLLSLLFTAVQIVGVVLVLPLMALL